VFWQHWEVSHNRGHGDVSSWCILTVIYRMRSCSLLGRGLFWSRVSWGTYRRVAFFLLLYWNVLIMDIDKWLLSVFLIVDCGVSYLLFIFKLELLEILIIIRLIGLNNHPWIKHILCMLLQIQIFSLCPWQLSPVYMLGRQFNHLLEFVVLFIGLGICV